MTYPVSVLIAHIPSRESFFRGFCLPSIEANQPEKILIDSGPGGGAAARNRMAKLATSKYIQFVDDDDIFRADALKILVTALEAHPDCAFAYGDMIKITLPGIPDHGWGPVKVHISGEWNAHGIVVSNYIDTPALIRRESFLGFDEDPKVARLHDWDLWIRMGIRCLKGLYVPGVLYHSWNLDTGASSIVPFAEADAVIRRKYGIR